MPDRFLFSAWMLCAALWVASSGFAEPYVPASDDEVLETLPRVVLSERGKLNTLRRQLRADRDNVDLASQLVRLCLAENKRTSDPRYIGYARAALRPWWDMPEPPPGILKLRAKLKEKDHLYDAALSDLELLLRKQPTDLQAWIEVANLQRTQGRYAQALSASEAMEQIGGGSFAVAIGRIPVLAVTGQAQEAYDQLEAILPEARDDWPSTVPWVLTLQADVARALGKDDQADAHFRAGLEIEPSDSYLLRSYGDFLLDHGRADEAMQLLREHTADNGILLRAAIAAKQAGQETMAQKWQDQLDSLFMETRLRGSIPHGRYESRYHLELKGDPTRALELALANWERQKEYRDTRNVLEAAIAAGARESAAPVVAFLREHRTQDVVLESLIKKLGAI